MLVYVDTVLIILFFIVVILFLRFLVCFCLLVFFNKSSKKKALNSGIVGISFFLIMAISWNVFLLYVEKNLSDKFNKLSKEGAVEAIKINDEKCNEDSYLFIKNLSVLGDKKTAYKKTEKRVKVEIVTRSGESFRVAVEKIISERNEYLVFYSNLIMAEQNHIGTIKTNYISECLSRKQLYQKGETKE